MKIRKLTIIIPIFNEINTLPELFKRVKAVRLNKEIILVDDGSTDGSTQWLKKLKKSRSRNVKFLFLPKNQGKGAAVKRALDLATGDYAVIQDADHEYNPAELVNLVKEAEKKKSLVVYGSRDSRIRNKYLYPHLYWGSRLLGWIINTLFNQSLSDPETCYKLVNTDLMKFIDLTERGFGIEIEITCKLAKLNLPIAEVPISYKPRSYEEGKKIRISDGIRAIWLVGKWWWHDQHFGGVDRLLRFLREYELFRHVRFSSKDTVIDAGCGKQAHLGWRLREKVTKYTGIDKDLASLKIQNLELIKDDVYRMTRVISRPADMVIGLAVIEHLKHPDKFLRDCGTVLKNGGKLVLTTPLPQSELILKTLAKLKIIDPKEIDEHKTYFSTGELKVLLEKCGFDVICQTRIWWFNSFTLAAKA